MLPPDFWNSMGSCSKSGLEMRVLEQSPFKERGNNFKEGRSPLLDSPVVLPFNTLFSCQ